MKYVWWSSRNWMLQVRFHWHLLSENGKIIATSGGQAYSRRIDMMDTIKLVRGRNDIPIVSRDGETL